MNFKIFYESINVKNLDDIINLIKKDFNAVIANTVKSSAGGNSKAGGINVGTKYIAYRTEDGEINQEFLKFAKAIKENEDKLDDAIQKVEKEKDRNYWNNVLKIYINDPKKIPKETRSIENEKNKGKGYNEPSHYTDIGEALVYRSSEFVSKMADSKTEINKNTFNQLMIDAFNSSGKNGGTSENLLNTITNMDEMMRIDAAKKTVDEQQDNGDADKKFGTEQQDENYYIDLKYNLDSILNEGSTKVPRKLSDFSDNKKTLLAQVSAVESAWPRQFKKNFEMYQAKFEEGVKRGQDAVRKGDKEVTDPLTGKKINARKGLGTGGPNAYLRDHETLNKLCDDIKGQKLTIFNMGPKMILGLFDMMEKGGKLLQGIKDEFGEALKDIKKAFSFNGSSSSNSNKEFNNQIDELIQEEQYGAAYATAEASAVVSFTQLLALLQNGPIGTVDLENHTFTLEKSGDQSSIEVAVQNLLASLDKYTETEKRFEENKDVKINDQQIDSKLEGDNEQKQKDKNQNETEEDDEEDLNDTPTQNASFQPKLNLRSFILNEENNDNDNKDENNDESEEDKQTQSDAANDTLNQFEIIKSNFDDNIDTNRLKEVMEVLKTFKGHDDKPVKDKNGNDVDFTVLNKVIDLYDTLAGENLKFNLDAANLKDFLEGIKSYINDYKEIGELEQLPIYLDENSKKFPAMEATGKLEVTDKSGEDRALELAKKLDAHRKTIISEYISKLDSFAKNDCKDDSWLNAYEAKNKKLDEAFNIVVKEINDVYGNSTPKWLFEYQKELSNQNYLSKLYMIMACLTTLIDQLNEMSKKQQDNNDEEDMDNDEQSLPNNTNQQESHLPKLTKLKLFENKIIYRSLYLTESDDQTNDDINAGNNNPSMENGHNEKKIDGKGGKIEPVKHSVAELYKRIEAVKLNDALLPTNPDADVYKKNDPKEFNRLSDAFANNATGLSINHVDSSNGIVSILRNVLNRFKEQSKQNAEIIKKNNCTQLASIFMTGQDKDKAHADLYLYFGCACGIAKVLKANLTEIEQNFDNKRGDNNTNDKNQNDENQEGENQEGGNQENKNEESYNYPNVSPDSLLNEIYKYIRG